MALRLLSLTQQLVADKDPASLPIQQYRKLSVVDTKTLKLACEGPNYHYKDRTYDMFIKNRHLFYHHHLTQADRKEMRQHSAKQLLFYIKNNPQTYYQYLKNPNINNMYLSALQAFDIALCTKYGVHNHLYTKTIAALGNKSHQKFCERAWEAKDIGCFCLTQLLHGSNVRGILTEAHYDHATQTFIIHSPSRNAMKFWIGAAANLANMAVVWAQLYINGKCFGVHAYIVPIRDVKTHDLLPGVLIGDCGPKNGNNAIDNGFLMFDKVRIPKENQLDRISGVDQNGNFFTTIQKQEKRFGVQLAALSGGRVSISYNSGNLNFGALAIAVRYTLNRRQFAPPKGTEETLLFEYPLTKFRLMPLLAQSVVYQIGSCELCLNFDANLSKLLDPKNKIVAQLHAISSAVKPKCSWFSADVIRQCRQMLGGHGYSAFSRLGSYYNDNDVNTTWEGDNNVLLQQTAKYLLDNFKKITSGKNIEATSLSFLKQPPTVDALTPENIKCLNFLENLMKDRVSKKLHETVAYLTQLTEQGMSSVDAWNTSQAFYSSKLGLYYGDLYMIQSVKRALEQMSHEATKSVVQDCTRLWAWKLLEATGYSDEETRKMLRNQIVKLCDIVAQQAVGILDSLAPPPEVIGSPFADLHGDGMKKYLNLLYSAKDTFGKVEWYQLITNRDRS